jgi:prepilin-type N-terminal cleavage/methylation domain-containing protein
MTPRTQAGFTITELSISVVVAGFMAAVIFAATFFYYTNVQQAEVSASLGLDSQSILTQLTDDTRLADAISTTNAITDSHAPVGGWVTSDPSNYYREPGR